MVHDLRALLRLEAGCVEEPSAESSDSRTIGNPLGATPESGQRVGCGGIQRVPDRQKGRKVHLAVDTFDHLLALYVTTADEQDRQQVYALAVQVQAVTGDSVHIAFVDQVYMGDMPQ